MQFFIAYEALFNIPNSPSLFNLVRGDLTQQQNMSNAQNQEAGVSRSSSASLLSSPPHTSPEPGSPSAQFANEQHSITVNHSVDLGPPAPVVVQPPARKKPGSLDCARFAYF